MWHCNIEDRSMVLGAISFHGLVVRECLILYAALGFTKIEVHLVSPRACV